MTGHGGLPDESADDLFEHAPCGYLSTSPDGRIARVNRTFEAWTGLDRGALVGRRRFQDLLSAGGRIYHETHFAPLLHMQDAVNGIALEIVRADGSLLPALVSSVVRRDAAGEPRSIRTIVLEATDRRSYEEELLRQREDERGVARDLQRSLLSGVLPDDRRLELAVDYRPGVRGLEVGGDWFDAFWLDDGRTVGLVVGDVVGRGVEAAVAMGQLRSAARALAATGLEPGRVLECLDAYAERHGVGGMTTLVYAQLDLRSRELRFAVAGHPPPLVVAPGARPAFAWDGGSPPLTAAGGASRAAAALRLPPGACVLLYTDGLVERRGRLLDEGLDRLAEEIARRRDDALPAIASAVVNALRDPQHADDTCLLLARLTATAPDGPVRATERGSR